MSETVDLQKLWIGDLGEVLDGPLFADGVLDPATGWVHQSSNGEWFDEDGETCDPDDLEGIHVPVQGSREAYADMEAFADMVPRARTRQRLQDALQGKGAFRRFRTVIYEAPDEIGKVWNRYRSARSELRALDWLEEQQLAGGRDLEAARSARHTVLDEVHAQLRPGRPATGASGAVDLDRCLSQVSEHWSPTVVARIDDHEVKVVKVQGEFVWHTHETDELFLVLDGALTIGLRDGEVTLGPGQLYVVPRHVEHCPRAADEVALLLIDAEGVVNTGDAEPSALTAPYDDSLLGGGQG